MLMTRLGALVVLAAALPAAAQGLKGIKGADDRIEVARDQYPWSAVARLNNGKGGHCSAILVGPALAVTAAHCLWNKSTLRPMPPTSLHVVAGYARGAYLGATRVVATSVAPGWQFGQPYSPALAAHDWAVLTLAEPLGDIAGWVAIGETAAAVDSLVAVGYGQDKAHIPAAHIGCRVAGRMGAGLLTHDCDAVHGDSGAPVLVWRAGQPTLAAIHVGTFTFEGGRVLGGAVPSASFAAEARRLGALATGKAGTASTALEPDIAARVAKP
ncbi:putative exported metallopeptidase [Magnetospirillum sp. LM-5]|uniref:trypsin-like serine peptidase n=1 Tax=Magnetospirillum sp. LM-5 TaxID=2681466 RepID=UPI00138507A7|nr:trypsin-like serine protease [Magnetospirillum sp. LM-5]CAA7611471.1 putative exported metallopeptidase [Magnetospirillum sp. LM-5]